MVSYSLLLIAALLAVGCAGLSHPRRLAPAVAGGGRPDDGGGDPTGTDGHTNQFGWTVAYYDQVYFLSLEGKSPPSPTL